MIASPLAFSPSFRLLGGLSLAVALTGCPGAPSVDAGPDPTEDAGPDEGAGPVWSDAPDEPVALPHGVTVHLPLTLEAEAGGAIAVQIDSAFAEVRQGEGELLVRADYALAGAFSFTVTLRDDEGRETSYPVEAEAVPLAWQERPQWSTAEGPEEREHGLALYDEATRQVFVFGGSGYHPQFQQAMTDFWRYDVDSATWTEIEPTGSPPEDGGSRRFAGDHGSGVGLLFGGYKPGPAAVDYDELYRVTVANGTLHFELLEQQNAPSARSLHGFAKDPGAERYVLFGGVSGNGIRGDTWVMHLEDDVAVWEELAPTPSPSARYGFFDGVDAASRRWVVFGGGQQPTSPANPVNAADDTWVLDFTADPPAWHALDVPALPPGRRNGCGILEPSVPRLFVFGGTANAATTEPGVFALDLTAGHERWEELTRLDGLSGLGTSSPPLRSSGFGFSDGEQVVCGFGNGAAVYRDWTVLGY